MSNRDRPLTRRRFVLATIGATTALAGCSGNNAPANGGDGAQGDGEPTPTAKPASSTPMATPASSTPTEDPTATAPPTHTAGDKTKTPDGADSVCAPLVGNPTAYDVSGTPYVFAFDYPVTWTLGDPIPGQSGRFQQMTSPAVSVNDTPRTATVRVGQSLAARSASEIAAEKDELMTRDVDALTVVGEQTFGGETVEVLGFPDVSPTDYPPVYTLYLPYGDGDRREYYRTSIVTYSDIYGLGDEETEACNESIRAATEMVRSSLRPNPETTVEDA